LGELYPRFVFYLDLDPSSLTILTILHPQGTHLPAALQRFANIIIEVRPDSVQIKKDQNGYLGGDHPPPADVWRHFQLCTRLTPDGILGPRTKAKMRELSIVPNGAMSKPEPVRKTALERLLEDD
jgi:hypothetical protein